MSKDMTNIEIAGLLRAVASAYQLRDEKKNKFRIIAYQRAADAVEHASSELKDLWDEGKLDEIPGIGKSIAEHLSDLFVNGKSKHFENVMEGFPPQMFDLMTVPGIGVKTAYKIVQKFKYKISEKNAVSDLEKLAKKGEIAKLEGFGEESQKDIIRSIEEVKGRTKRHLLPYALAVASEITSWLKECKYVEKVDPLGSLRRKAPTVGDIDIAVASKNALKVIEHFTNFPKKQRILERGERTASIIVPGDIQVDLMVQFPEQYGSLLQHFTGSKHHNIALREYANKLSPSLSLSEYGIKNLKTKKLKKVINEEDFYNTLDLEWIPPELREGNGEISAAKRSVHGKTTGLPDLVDIGDIKSDLQIHSSFDIETSHDLGESTMEEVINRANHLEYEYIAFTEHNPSQSHHSDKEVIEILKRKKEVIEKINYSLKANSKSKRIIKVFNSLEIDIKPDGSLPVSDNGLMTLDFALVSIHTSFNQSREDMTKRIVTGLSRPKVRIFAHPTARKLNEREGIEIDWEEVFNFCLNNDKWLEINSDPMRLDLPDFLVKEAIKHKVKLSLGTDSHHISQMDNMIYGLSVARRGWAEKKDIVNTLSLKKFEEMLK